jgi:hypothetical protein
MTGASKPQDHHCFFSGLGPQAIAGVEGTRQAGVTYLYRFMPGLALQFAIVSMGAALRGCCVRSRPPRLIAAFTRARCDRCGSPRLLQCCFKR